MSSLPRLLAVVVLVTVAVPALAQAQTADLRRKITVNGQSSAQSIRVTARDIERTGVIVQRAVGAGATRVSGPEFFVSNASRSYREALGAAFDDAKADAEVLAARAGAQLGAVLSIEESTDTEPVPEPRSAAPLPLADAPAPPVQAGESRLEASVVVVFELVG